MNQTTETPTTEDLSEIEAMRTWVREHYTPETRHLYDSVSGKINLLETILANPWIEPTETLKLQCLGITLGDALAQQLGPEWINWVMVSDEYGRDPALQVTGTSILIFPLTMISKRIEAGEKVIVGEMFNQTILKIKDILRETTKNPD